MFVDGSQAIVARFGGCAAIGNDLLISVLPKVKAAPTRPCGYAGSARSRLRGVGVCRPGKDRPKRRLRM